MQTIHEETLYEIICIILSYLNSFVTSTECECIPPADVNQLTPIMTMSLVNKKLNSTIMQKDFWTSYFHKNYKYGPDNIYTYIQTVLDITHTLKNQLKSTCSNCEFKNINRFCKLEKLEQILSSKPEISPTDNYSGRFWIPEIYECNISYFCENEWFAIWTESSNCNYINVHRKHKIKDSNQTPFKKYEINKSNQEELHPTYYANHIWYVTKNLNEKYLPIFNLYAINIFTDITYLLFSIDAYLGNSITITSMDFAINDLYKKQSAQLILIMMLRQTIDDE